MSASQKSLEMNIMKHLFVLYMLSRSSNKSTSRRLITLCILHLIIEAKTRAHVAISATILAPTAPKTLSPLFAT